VYHDADVVRPRGTREDHMTDATSRLLEGLRVDRKNLYREETVTDLKVATLKRLVPITIDGEPDLGRSVRFLGQTQIMSQMGPLPVQCQIEATTLDEAIEKFPEAVKAAVDEMLEEAREMQRQEMSRIVVPDVDTTSKIIGG
jgi:hypothetical protein